MRQKKSGSVRKAKARIEKILSRPMTKDSHLGARL